jgi:hypothetical protein
MRVLPRTYGRRLHGLNLFVCTGVAEQLCPAKLITFCRETKGGNMEDRPRNTARFVACGPHARQNHLI